VIPGKQGKNHCFIDIRLLNRVLMRSTPIDYLNDHFDYEPVSLKEDAGGYQQKWKEALDLKPDVLNTIIPEVGITVEVISEHLENISIVDVPIFLDPKTATWLDVAHHAKARQNLGSTTIEKHFRTARFMINHPLPVDFRNLSIESVIKHFDYRRAIENASRDALRHERDAVFMFLRAFKQFTDEWKEYVKLPKKRRGTSTPFVLFPKMLNHLYHGSYGKTHYEDVLFQTIVFTVANFGMRPPSEIINLDLQNVVINKDGTGYIWIKEDKKGGIERQYFPFDKKVLSSRVYRTPANYMNTWRHKVANDLSGDALFLMPDGKRVTGKYIRDHISMNGKIIVNDDRFKLYTLRHTFATYYYDWTRDLKKVARRLGHNKTDSVDHYIGICDDLKTQIGKKANLFDQALRHFKDNGGKQGERDCRPKKALSQKVSPVGGYGPAEAQKFQQEKKLEIVLSFWHYLNIGISTISFYFSFFKFLEVKNWAIKELN